MSTNDQDTKQAPAPFAVGQQVRCATNFSGHSIRYNKVATVASVNDDTHIMIRGVDHEFHTSHFVPAVPFVDSSGKKWLVVDERVPDVDKDVWVDLIGQVNTPEFGFRQSYTNTNGGRRRILAEWVEFPAPAEAKAEPVTEDWQLRCAHAETELEIARGTLEDARRELALVKQVLSGNGGVSDDMGSESLKMALEVMARAKETELERDGMSSTIKRVWSALEAYPHGPDGWDHIYHRVEDVVATANKAEQERDSLRARVAELEAERTTAPVSIPYLLTVLEERQATCFMEHAMAKYGELNCDYHKWLSEIRERRAALAGKEAK